MYGTAHHQQAKVLKLFSGSALVQLERGDMRCQWLVWTPKIVEGYVQGHHMYTTAPGHTYAGLRHGPSYMNEVSHRFRR